jgi:hypothetical protein
MGEIIVLAVQILEGAWPRRKGLKMKNNNCAGSYGQILLANPYNTRFYNLLIWIKKIYKKS